MGIGRTVATALGAATTGPLGGLLGNLVGGFLESIFPNVDASVKAVAANLSQDVVRRVQEGVLRRAFPERAERRLLADDLQGAFRDAVRAALADIGGPGCLPEAWRGVARDVPPAARYPFEQHGPDLGARLAGCLCELDRAIGDGRVLPRDAGPGQPAAAAVSYLAPDDPLALGDLLVDEVVGPFLADEFASLMAEAPELCAHLRRHLLDRALIHLAELLKERPRAWRAFNRLLLEGLRAQLDAVGAGQAEITARLDALLAQGQAGAIGALSDELAALLAATGQAEKRLGESLERLQARVVGQHRELLARLEALTASSLRIERGLARVGRILERLEGGAVVIHGAAPVVASAAPEPGEPPFQGLRAFEAADAARFFGREALVAALTRRLRDLLPLGAEPPAGGRFLAVVGASGSGKSSVVRAGLIPALAAGAPLADGGLPPDGSGHWAVRVLTPGARPLEALALSLIGADDSVRAASALAADLAADPRCLDLAARRLLAGRPADERLLLVVDQFEELFTVCKDEAARGAFVAAVLHAAAEPGPVVAVITLRADFYAACGRYEGLRAALAAQQVYIGPMGPDELRRAIEEPARLCGWVCEPGLVEVLLHDVGDEPGALPLLSHALLQTWERRRGRTMTLESYVESGMVRGAIAQTAEGLYAGLAPEQRGLARRIFLRLAEPGADGRDTRRRAARDELAASPEEAIRVEALLVALADARLITTGDGVVEVAHEALIREWPTLRRWLEEGREGLRVHRALTEHAQEWARLGRDAGAMYRGARLAAAAEWAAQDPAALNALEREFLAASQEAVTAAARAAEEARQRELAQARALAEEQRRRAEEQAAARARQRRLNRFLIGALACAIIAALSAVWAGSAATRSAAEALVQRATAVAEGQRAERSARAAHSLALAAEASAANGRDEIQLAVTLAVEAVQADPGAPRSIATLGRLADSAPRLVLQGHEDRVTAVATSPDGRHILSGSFDKTLRLWDMASGALLRVLAGHRAPVTDAAFTLDGMRAVSVDSDGYLLVWDLASGETLLTIDAATPPSEAWMGPFIFGAGGLRALAVDPGGATVFAGTEAGIIRRWSLADGTELPAVGSYPAMLYSLAASPDGHMLAAGYADGAIVLWDLTAGVEAGRLAKHIDAVLDLSFSPDSAFLLSGAADKRAIVWDVASRKAVRTFSGYADDVTAVAFGPDGHMGIRATRSGDLGIWLDLHRDLGYPVSQSLSAPGAEILSVAFSPDGRGAVAGDLEGNVVVWELLGLPQLSQITMPDSGIHAVALSADGSVAASATWDGIVIFWEPAAGRELRRITAHSGGVSSVALSPDGRLALTGGYGGDAALWELATGRELRRLSASDAAVRAVAFTPDASAAVVASASDLRVWDVSGDAAPRIIALEDELASFSLGPGGHTAAAGFATALVVLDMSDGRPLLRLPQTSRWGSAVALSPDGRLMLASSAKGPLTLWDSASGQLIRTMVGHTGEALAVAFSADGRLAVSGGRDGTVRLWDVASGQELRKLTWHSDTVTALALSVDGRTLVSGSDDGTARAWLLETPTELVQRALAERAGMELGCDQRALYHVEPFCTLEESARDIETP